MHVYVFCVSVFCGCMSEVFGYTSVKANPPVKITRGDLKLLPPSLEIVADKKRENGKLEKILEYKNSWQYENFEDFLLKFQHELNHQDNRAFRRVTEYIRGLQLRRRVYEEGDVSTAGLSVLKEDLKGFEGLQKAGGEFLEKLFSVQNSRDWQKQVESVFINYVSSVAKVWSEFYQFVNFFQEFSASLELVFRAFYIAVDERGYWDGKFSKVDYSSYPNFERIIYKMPWEKLPFDSLVHFVRELQLAILFQAGKLKEHVKYIENGLKQPASRPKASGKPRKVVKERKNGLIQGPKKKASGKPVGVTRIPFAICCECARLAFDCSVVV